MTPDSERTDQTQYCPAQFQQLLSSIKNPTTAFVLALFLAGITLSPAMSLAFCLATPNRATLSAGSADFFALGIGFVASCAIGNFFIVDKTCSVILRRKGRPIDAMTCAWTLLRFMGFLYPLSFISTVAGAALLYSSLYEHIAFQGTMLAILGFSPLALIERSNSLREENWLVTHIGLSHSLRSLIGSIVSWAIFPVAILCAYTNGTFHTPIHLNCPEIILCAIVPFLLTVACPLIAVCSLNTLTPNTRRVRLDNSQERRRPIRETPSTPKAPQSKNMRRRHYEVTLKTPRLRRHRKRRTLRPIPRRPHR